MVKIYISFKGRCKEALKFYEEVFNSKPIHVIHYSDIPNGDPLNTSILHAEMDIEGTIFIFSDYMEGMTIGDNFTILLEVNDDKTVVQYYEKMRQGAKTIVALGPRDLPGDPCSLYVNLQDRYHMNWIILCRK